MKFKLLNKNSGKDLYHTNEAIARFLYDHLDQYGDKIEHIKNALEYVFSDKGGFVLLALEDKEIVGAVVMNDTGMKGYIPENILVYIAVHTGHRGKGIGKALMENAIKLTSGAIALHVEPDNPAVHLYEKMGFTNKYLEMRLIKS